MRHSERRFLTLVTVLFIVCLNTKSSIAQCKIAQIVQSNKLAITPPYKYDGFSIKEIVFDSINKTVKTEFIAFKNQKYKLLFCTSDFEDFVTINIYDKNAKKKDEGKKIAKTIIGNQQKNWTFEPPKSTTYIVEYLVLPRNDGTNHKGCIVMMISFSDK